MDCYRPEPARFSPGMRLIGLLFLAFTCAFAQSPSPTTPASELTSLLKRANAGDAEAEFQLGYTYEQGSLAVAQDYTRALYWYRNAAAQGNNDAP
ncbi:MAG: SEL1-like repeat protein, partial [Acidobacteriaceae bacterium]|nr:SEL1-like repeat protein [Acidobacteriaceae bacterium]